MIPHGREAIDAKGVAEALGMAYKTFRNKGGAEHFGLQPFVPGRRKPLYDRAQVEAVRDGRVLPTWSIGTRQHPDDLLDEQDVAEALGITYAAVRKDRSAGRLPGWVDVCGVAHIKRAALRLVIASRPGRGVGGGRPRKATDADRQAG
ncbi:hypothetical protein FHS43_000552 [Streptosporangium becharense]|uniref:DNA-binding protein n=1 Tax=Streptosporangium becharense TaxID=1816182 RepID=A0A7W9INW3_9ACTN|nr:hypothetical protein [Streptosporangium becharense]MBB2909306.1 hypothetical protein [Streptosporangium becharense]MBB5823791.1 hypothetical protein [Streptosporangium becharense]